MGGTIMVLGETDTGKSVFCHWLVERLAGSSPTAWLDCDMGQSTLGMPSTMNLGSAAPGGCVHQAASFFVGKTSPVGHMLPTVVGARLLHDEAHRLGAHNVIVDTSGLVSRRAGGGALKEWKMELLRPEWVVALCRKNELEHVVAPLRKAALPRLVALPPSSEVKARSSMERAGRRREKFRSFFQQARTWTISKKRVPVFGLDKAKRFRVAGLLGDNGLLISLCLVLGEQGSWMEVSAPEHDPGRIRGIRIGDMGVDPETGVEMKD
ncbi:MAG: Clp1/GlmU family protein, partial [Desulfovibrionales bacterium]